MSWYEPKITSSRCELIELSYNEIVMSAKDILDYGDIRPDPIQDGISGLL